MKKLMVLATATTLCFGGYAVNGLCQAAAEYSTTTSAVASGAANAGSSLGAALNNVTGNASKSIGQSSKSVPQARRPGGRATRGVAVRLGANAQALQYARRMRLSSNLRETAPDAGESRAALPPCATSPAPSSTDTKAADAKTNPACKPELEVAYPSTLKLSFPNK